MSVTMVVACIGFTIVVMAVLIPSLSLPIIGMSFSLA